MNCPNCGRQVNDTASFCPGCGAAVTAPQPEPKPEPQPVYQPAPAYQAPAYQAPAAAPTAPVGGPNLAPVGIGNWIGVFVLSAIPVVNLIMLIVWAASSGTKKSLKNYAIAALIMMGVAILLTVLLWGVIVAAFTALGDLSSIPYSF